MEATMKRFPMFLILALIVAACTGCDQPADYGTNIPFRTVMRGALGGEEGQVVATNDGQWRELWGRVRSGEPATMDFGKEMAIGLFLGHRSDGGYDINVLEVTERNNAILVTYEEQIAGDNCARIGMPTSPSIIIAINRTSKPIQYKKQVVTKSCE